MNNQLDELTRSMTQPLSRRNALKTLGLSLAGLAVTRFGLNETQAITNGQLDGDAHPNVGGFIWLKNIWSPDPPPVCIGTGSLIHPRVVLTAGHGTYAVESATSSGMMTMDDFLISFASDATQPATWRSISAVLTHPDYADKPEGNGNVPVIDVGVAILRESATGVTVMPLPPAGFLDELQATGQLRDGSDHAKFTVVGYGAVLGDQPNHVLFPPDGLRRNTQSAYRELHERWVFLDSNGVFDLGGAGTGDSGGPALWIDPATAAATLVAVTSRGNLASLDSKPRVDIPEVLDFLNQVIARVEAGEL